MRIATAMKSFGIEKYQRDIPDDAAFNFVYMLEHGISIDALIDTIIKAHRYSDMQRKEGVKILCRNKYLRNSELFCVLVGVRRIPLAGTESCPINK